MKTIIAVGVIGLIVGGIALSNKTSSISYEASEPQVIEKEVEVEVLDKRIKEAQDAKLEATEATANAAYKKAYDQAMLEIELEVTSQFRLEIEEREKMLQASSTAY